MATGVRAALGLVGPDTVRAVARAARADVPTTPSSGEPDPDLLAPVERPFESLDDAAERLRSLEVSLREAGDRRAVFLTVYTRMTATIRAAIDAGRFADVDWMRDYTVRFADYYRQAFRAFEAGELEAVPDAWVVAFDAATAGTTLVAQDVFLGINAHINYDLALTLRDLGLDPDRAAKRADHRRVNEVLSGLVDAQQRALAELYAPGLEDLDRSLGRLDERLTLLSLTQGREQAWRLATVYSDAALAPLVGYARWVHRATATGAAQFIRSPPVDPAVLEAMAAVEREAGVEAVTRALAEGLDRAE